MFIPMVLGFVAPWMVSPAAWWTTLIPIPVAIGFYVLSLRATTAIFPTRREQLMAVVEGRA